MFVDFTRYVEFLSKKKLTANQFAFLWMLHYKDWGNMKKYNSKVGKFNTKDIEYLENEGYILSTRKKEDRVQVDINDKEQVAVNLKEMMVTHLFTNEIIIEDPFEALQEVVNVYPAYFMIHGKKQLTTAVDLDQLALVYDKINKKDKIQHKIIVEKTKIVAEMMNNGELQYMKIDKYIRGRNWSAADMKDDNRDIRKSI